MSFESPGDDKRCDHCNQPGESYVYMGQRFSGLIAYEGDRVCLDCADRKIKRDTANAPILPISPSRYR